MKMTDSSIDEFYDGYEDKSGYGVCGSCSICGEDIYAEEEHYCSPIWDGERLICCDCIRYGNALKDLFEELDEASKLECLGVSQVYPDSDG